MTEKDGSCPTCGKKVTTQESAEAKISLLKPKLGELVVYRTGRPPTNGEVDMLNDVMNRTCPGVNMIILKKGQTLENLPSDEMCKAGWVKKP